MKVLATNRRARFDYDLGESMLAGISLEGHEVKSLKNGKASLKGAFIVIKHGEAYLMGSHITPYAQANNKLTIDPTRQRKLLLHRRQIDDLIAGKESGRSIVPTTFVLAGPFVKVELALGVGRKRYDKRAVLKARDDQRQTARELVQRARHRN